jgi:hypothetical protein
MTAALISSLIVEAAQLETGRLALIAEQQTNDEARQRASDAEIKKGQEATRAAYETVLREVVSLPGSKVKMDVTHQEHSSQPSGDPEYGNYTTLQGWNMVLAPQSPLAFGGRDHMPAMKVFVHGTKPGDMLNTVNFAGDDAYDHTDIAEAFGKSKRNPEDALKAVTTWLVRTKLIGQLPRADAA